MWAAKTLGVGGLMIAVAFGGLSAPAYADQVRVHGHGFGHGHGMSQYGAQGAALDGRSYQQILERYYPGTSLDAIRGPIRVLITADTSADVKVSPTPGLTLRDYADKQTWLLPTGGGIDRWRIMPDGQIELHNAAGWRQWAIPGRTTLRGTGAFLATGPITLWVASGNNEVRKSYRGELRAAQASSSTLDTVNVLSMNSYLRGVVAAEMPASWEPAALRAQAVAARTYAAYLRSLNPGRYYHTCDTTACQVYAGVAAETGSTDQAIAQTGQQILRYAGAPALTQFSASSGGYTASGGTPYLPAQPDPWDDWPGNPVHTWSATVNTATLEQRFPSLGTLVSMEVTQRNGFGDFGGRARRVLLNGSRDNITITGDTFSAIYGLRSNWFRFG